MNKVLNYFKENLVRKPIVRNSRVYGWKFEYDHLIVSSISKYLFEDLDIIENIAPQTNTNRDGRKMESVEYICVHDTGDTDHDHTAFFWSNVVSVQNWEMGRYEASFQYVTGNDGVFHNIPDDEIGYHAGDGTQKPYKLYDSGLSGENTSPVVSVSSDGYYMVDGIKSKLLAPRAYKEKDSVVIYDRVATNDDIVTQGIECINVNGKYMIGESWWSSGYSKLANKGGNCNSIGIESCINVGSDIYLTWQITAKLVAKLLDENKLSFDRVKQHNFFSGKNCPQTIRMNGFWDHFMELVQMEYDVLKFKQEGYKIRLIVNDKDVKENGRIVKRDFNSEKKRVSYTIQTELNGEKEEETFEIEL